MRGSAAVLSEVPELGVAGRAEFQGRTGEQRELWDSFGMLQGSQVLGAGAPLKSQHSKSSVGSKLGSEWDRELEIILALCREHFPTLAPIQQSCCGVLYKNIPE